MMFFPRVTQKIQLNVPKDILIRELSKELDFGASSIIWFKNNNKSFAGFAEGNSFQIKLKTSYRNSFKPIVNIAFVDKENGTEIFIDYSLELPIKIVISVFMSILGLIQVIIMYFNFDNIFAQFRIENFFPLIMIIFQLLMSRMGFYMSQSHSEDAIHRILIVARNNYMKNQRMNQTYLQNKH